MNSYCDVINELNLIIEKGGFDAKRAILNKLSESGHHVDPFYLNMINRHQTAFTSAKLDELLKAIREKLAPSDSMNQISKAKPAPPAKYEAKSLPESLKSMDESIRTMYKLNRLDKGKLTDIFYHPDGNKRKRISLPRVAESRIHARSIVERDKEIARMYQHIDYFLQTGKLLEDEVKPSDELTKLRYWLSCQIEVTNYVRKCETFHKKNKRYQNEEKYRQSKQMLAEIAQYLTAYGQ